MRQLVCLVLTIWACSPSAMADPGSAAPLSSAKGVQHIETGTPASTPSGTTFTVPAGWTMTMKGQVVVLSPPEPDLKYALIDVEAKDAAAAVAAGWAAFDPGFKRPLRVSEPNPPRLGWEERVFFDYEVSPNEKLRVQAYAWRAGKNWLVGMLQTSLATQEKRGGPFSAAYYSVRPKDYKPEVFSGKPAHPIDAQTIAAMTEFVAGGMQQLQVPGVGLSLIDGGKIVYEGGLGVREVGKPDPVDADTLFMAASNTKALSTLMLAELVDEKKLRWDEPVTEAYPAFKLGDAATTRQVLIKQLVCACTGMPRQDFDRKFANGQRDTPATAIQRLGTMQPTSKFGEVFQYSNPLAAAAGFIGGTIAIPDTELGKAYDQAMQQMVFDPLGMTRSTFDFAKAMQGDYARPHDVDREGHLIVGQISPNYTIIPLRPAGGLWTSAHDLSQYVMMELAKGMMPNGQRLVSEKNLLQRRVPNVAASEYIDYGMGLEIETIAGVTVVHHGGSLEGYKSDMIWLPDYNVGAVILTNSNDGSTLHRAFLRKLMELLFDGKPEADGQIKAAAASNAIEIIQTRKELHERMQVPADPVVAAKLAAHYINDALGSITITRDSKDVVLLDGYLQSPMASRKNDDRSISIISIAPNMQGLFEFVIGERDLKRTLTLRDAQHEYVFVEQVIDDPAYTHAQRLVEVEPGRRLNLYCLGTGSPTVIFDSGSGDDTSAWALVQPTISTHTRTCAYDRAGLGFSDPGRRAGDSAKIVDDLHRLLVAASVKPPYILVGHSLGGMNVRLYADQHFDEVAGMVLVDTADEDWLDYAWTIDPDQQSREHLYAANKQGWQQDRDCVAAAKNGLVEGTEDFKRCVPAVDPLYSAAINAVWLKRNRSAEHLRAVLSEEESVRTMSDDEVRAARRWYGNLPLIVLKSSLITKLGTGETQKHRDAINHLHLWLIDQYGALSTRGEVRIVPDSNHNIQMSQPESVIAAILEVLKEAADPKEHGRPAQRH